MKELKLDENIHQNKTISEILPTVSKIFDSILNGDDWMEEFYMHPLGFFYCRLFNSEEFQIRLHIWEVDYKKKEDLFIHDHYYDLCSWVLCGKIVDYTYSIKRVKEKTKYARFTSNYKYGNNIRTLQRTTEFYQIERVLKKEITGGEKYFISKGMFHSNDIIFENTDITVTIVIGYNYNQSHSPNVIGLYDNKVYQENDPQKVSKEKVINIIEKAKTEIFSVP